MEQLALSRQLSRASFRVDTAANLDDAEAFLASVRYRAVLVDLDASLSIQRMTQLRDQVDVQVYALCKSNPAFCAGGCDALDGVFHHPLRLDAFVLMLRAKAKPQPFADACDKASLSVSIPKLRLLSS